MSTGSDCAGPLRAAAGRTRPAHRLGGGRRPRRVLLRALLRRGDPHATAWSEGVVAEARLGSFFGCQFHPEKSGGLGARYLEEALSLSRV